MYEYTQYGKENGGYLLFDLHLHGKAYRRNSYGWHGGFYCTWGYPGSKRVYPTASKKE